MRPSRIAIARIIRVLSEEVIVTPLRAEPEPHQDREQAVPEIDTHACRAFNMASAYSYAFSVTTSENVRGCW